MGTAHQINLSMESIGRLRERQAESIKNLLNENCRLQKQIIYYQLGLCLLGIAAVFAYALVGGQ